MCMSFISLFVLFLLAIELSVLHRFIPFVSSNFSKMAYKKLQLKRKSVHVIDSIIAILV